jgi:type I restriction enzyme S subunit
VIESTTLAQLAERGVLYVNDGYRTKASELGADGLPVLRVAEVRDGSIQPAFKDRVRGEFRPKMGGKTSRPDDVLITTKGTVGRAAMVPESLPEFVYSPQLCVLRVLDDQVISPRWLYAWVRSPAFQRQANVVAGQTDMAPYINLVDLRRMTVELPSLPAQQAVAEVLGALDDKIDANARLVPLLRDLAKTRLQSSVVPESAHRVGDVADVRKGLSYTGAGLAEAGMPMVNLANAENFGWLKRSGFKHYTGAYKPRHVAQPGALLIAGVEQTWRNEIIGWPMLLPDDVGDALFSQDVFLVDFQPEHTWLRLPLWAHLYTFDARTRLEGMAYGTTVARFPSEALTGLEFPAPREGDPALDAADELLRRAWAAERESAALVTLRDALLPSLISGELRVREAASLANTSVPAAVAMT